MEQGKFDPVCLGDFVTLLADQHKGYLFSYQSRFLLSLPKGVARIWFRGGAPISGGGADPYFSPQTPNHKGPPLCRVPPLGLPLPTPLPSSSSSLLCQEILEVDSPNIVETSCLASRPKHHDQL